MRFHKLEEAFRQNKEFHCFVPLMQNAIKFYCGNIDQMPHIADSLIVSDFPLIPFPVCAFEMIPCDECLPVIFLCVNMRDDGNEVTDLIPFAKLSNDLWGTYYSITINRTNGEMNFRKNKGVSTDEADERMRMSHQTLLHELARFLRVLNCANVSAVDVAAPCALNEKRIKKGVLPIYSYKVLTLKNGKARSAYMGGSHNSPRVHLRRGHIKHRKTGDFWWQPHAVGDRRRGVVMKDYNAEGIGV